jgi:translation initiation factor IF-2
MAKKRVHEIAKEKGISSKEVLAILQKAGLDVKAAASSVDEADIERAFGGSDGASNGADSAGERPPSREAAREAAKEDGPSPEGSGRQQRSQRRPRPTRGEEPPAGGGGGRRRVVIDSQASRGRPAPPPPVGGAGPERPHGARSSRAPH